MGLGPPVCLDCKRICDLTTEEERNQKIEDGTWPESACRWWCSKCGGYTFVNAKDCSDATFNESSLWSLPQKVQREYEKNR